MPFLTPGPGLRVLDPDTLQPLPESGALVPDTSYWRRVVARGDAAETPPTSVDVAATPLAAPAPASPSQE